MSYVFKIEKVVKRGGGLHERHSKRKGQRVKFDDIGLSRPFVASYIEDNNAILTTSSVEAYSSDWKETGFLVIQTENSVYVLREEEAADGEN